MQPDKDIKEVFVEPLLEWFRANRRDLPWRANKDPYRVWVSEVMLQQTRVDTVIPYYERFMDRFPTLEVLADAPEEEVLKSWEGLGYYSRARNLQMAAREVKERYNGVIPDNPEEIASLKGIGPYTAGAILSIAYNRPEPAVDGNVMRVLSRFFRIHDDIAKVSTRKRMEQLVRGIIPHESAGDFNQALMELGALVCTPRGPQCLICPVMEHCGGRLAGEEERLPVKTKAKPPRPERRLAALITGTGNMKDKVLFRLRPGTGLLAGMWELPHVEVPGPRHDYSETWKRERLKAGLKEEGIEISSSEWMMRVEHTFSHIHWDMDVYLCVPAFGQDAPLPEGWRWMDAEERKRAAFPNVFLRILERVEREFRET